MLWGLRMALECHHLDYENKDVAIIGSGGAAYASVVSVMAIRLRVFMFLTVQRPMQQLPLKSILKNKIIIR